LSATTGQPLTGRRVALIAGTLFALVFAPNIVLAVLAVKTFSGLVVPNSYVASQQFDRARDAQSALGWKVDLIHETDRLALAFTDSFGNTVRPEGLSVTLGRPTTTRNDTTVILEPTPGDFAGSAPLAPGRWRVEIAATAADGTAFRQSRSLFVRGSP
jgi:nitrogen fixation protein FixH